MVDLDQGQSKVLKILDPAKTPQKLQSFDLLIDNPVEV
jgi:hypothetical protein